MSWARLDSNQRATSYEPAALPLSYRPTRMRLLTAPGGQPCRVYHTVPKRAYDEPGAPEGMRARGRPSPHRRIVAIRTMRRQTKIMWTYASIEGGPTVLRSDISGPRATAP